MYKFGFLLVVFLYCTHLSAQVSEVRTFSDFSIIKVETGINVYLSQSDTFQVEVKSGRSSIHRVIIEQFNNTLQVYTKNNYRWGKKEKCEVYIKMPVLVAVTAGHGSDIYSLNALKGDVVFMKATGGADIYLTIDCNAVKASAINGGSITLVGNGENISAKASSGGNVWAKSFKAAYAKVIAGAGSQIEVNVSHYLEAESTGGDIRYRGTPANKNINEAGSGDVKAF